LNRGAGRARASLPQSDFLPDWQARDLPSGNPAAGCGSLADYISAICAKSFGTASAAEAPYLAENVSAMTKMMIDMGIRPSGDVDTDFVAMMVPHHQGAIEMAQAELRYGRNEPLRRMAQEIIVTQRLNIQATTRGNSEDPSKRFGWKALPTGKRRSS
jgi:hypothetical protein